MTIDYGYDIGMGPTLIDLDPNMIDIGGRTLLVQSCVRRLVTYRGTLVPTVLNLLIPKCRSDSPMARR